MIYKAANVIERSLVMSHTARRSERRRQEILNLEPRVKRTAALMLHSLAVDHPAGANRLLHVLRQVDAAPVIGAGYNAVVYRTSAHEVVKVHASTIGLPATSQAELASTMNERHAVVRTYLGDHGVDQHTRVGTHPNFPKIAAVTTHQQFYDITDPDLFHARTNQLKPDAWHRLQAAVPAIVQAGRDMATAALDCYTETGVMPDLSGQGNLALLNTTAELILIDGHPISDSNDRSIKRSYQRLKSLAAV